MKFEELQSDIVVDYVFPYFLTVKPDPQRHFDVDKFINYLHDRHYKLWICDVQSETGYRHLHGVISFPQQKDYKRIRNTLQRYINNNIGFCKLARVEHLYNVFAYIGKHTIITEYIRR